MTAARAVGRGAAAPTVLDESLFFKLVRVVNLTARPFHDRVGRAHRLTLNEWRVMTVVGSHPGIAATDVCTRSGMDKMSVSRAIAGLAARQRIVRRPDAGDRRRVLLQLSGAGQRLYERIATTAREREAQLFGGLGAAEQAQLSATLDRLIERLDAVDAG